MKVKVGDQVKILAGQDKGKESKVIATYKNLDKVLVEGIHMVKKHQKGNGRDVSVFGIYLLLDWQTI